jgi:hypothetical protein
MADQTTRPDAATRWIETSRGVLSYAQLAPLLAERVLRVQQGIEAEIFLYLFFVQKQFGLSLRWSITVT